MSGRVNARSTERSQQNIRKQGTGRPSLICYICEASRGREPHCIEPHEYDGDTDDDDRAHRNDNRTTDGACAGNASEDGRSVAGARPSNDP